MSSMLWWVLGAIGTLILLFLLWFGYRALKFRRLQPIIFEYLALQDVEEALKYIDEHPPLLTPDAEAFIQVLLDRAWTRGDARTFVTGVIRLSLLVGCQEYGIEAARQIAADSFQDRFDAADSPSWQRSLDLLGKLVTEGEADISPEEVDEELVEAMEQIMELLRPLAATEDTVALQEEIVSKLHQILRQEKAK
jgi:hypothetical protein